MSERAFERALQRFAAEVGSEWVFSSDEDVALYRDAYSPLVGEDEKVAMSEFDVADSNFMDGKVYTYTRSINQDGDNVLNYRFYASDGTDDATGPPTGLPPTSRRSDRRF